MRKPALLISGGFHVAGLLLLMTAAVVVRDPVVLAPHKVVMPMSVRYDPPLRRPPVEDSGGNGLKMAESAAPESPARRSPRPFQPRLVAVNYDPQLAVQVVLTDAPGFDAPTFGIGDLTAIPGGGGGLNGPAGPPGGEGNGKGPGRGDGFREGAGFAGKITRSPQLIYKEEPEYSEAARKAHIQGTVRLTIEVGLDGRPTNIRLVRGVGLGLDENAMEAVRKWRFRPALSGDKPVVAPAVVDVGFFLL